MAPLPFLALYALCLAVVLGGVQALLAGWEAPPPPTPVAPTSAEQAIAVPPRPEGVRPVQGEGEEGGHRYTEEGCRELDSSYRDICFHQLARQRAPTDLQGGLDACGMMTAKGDPQPWCASPEDQRLGGCDPVSDGEGRMECQADVAELYSPADREEALQVCPTIARKKWSDQCVFGIALAWSHLDPEWAFRLCGQSGQWHDFCRHDVNGEISQFDDALALSHCAEEEGDALRRKGCWHGIGKYIARVDLDRAYRVCDQVPPGPGGEYPEQCFHGLGWGAAEQAGADYRTACAPAGDHADSCKLGFAYNLRRFDQPAGLQICSTVQRPDLRARCEEFVTTGRVRG